MLGFFIHFFLQLQGQVQEAKVSALTSVVFGKKVESEAITLHKKVESKTAYLFECPSILNLKN